MPIWRNRGFSMADIGKSDVERHELWAEVPGVALIIVGACAMLFGIILYIVATSCGPPRRERSGFSLRSCSWSGSALLRSAWLSEGLSLSEGGLPKSGDSPEVPVWSAEQTGPRKLSGKISAEFRGLIGSWSLRCS